MTKNQRVVVEYLSNPGRDFLSNLVELEGSYDSIPEEVYEAFIELTDKEKIEVIKKSESDLLKKY